MKLRWGTLLVIILATLIPIGKGFSQNNDDLKDVWLVAFAVVRLVLAWKHASRGYEKLGRLPPLSEQDRRKARERLFRTSAPRTARGTQRIELPPGGKAMVLRRM